jgi:hypothetical protein
MIHIIMENDRSRDSSVGTAKDYGLDGRGSIPSRDFFYSTTSRPPLGPTQPPTKWVPEAPSPGVK